MWDARACLTKGTLRSFWISTSTRSTATVFLVFLVFLFFLFGVVTGTW